MRGGDSNGIRAYNEKLVVSAILQEGSLSKAELARTTGLSANAAMVIANRLIEQGLLVKCDPVRGQIGQPSTPIAVNPKGAFALGVKVGRRAIKSLLINLSGETVASRETSYVYPEPVATLATAVTQCTGLLSCLDPFESDRVMGLGIAMPGDLHAWTEELGVEPGALDGWRDADIAGELAQATGIETSLFNDASAACAAEMIVGNGITHQSALYIYFGTFIGGGIVIGGRLYQGERRNAGSIGSMPAGNAVGSSRQSQLIHCASLIQLETLLKGEGIDPAAVVDGNGGEMADAVFSRWMETAVPAVARAILSALSVIDFEAVVIDGNMKAEWCGALRSRIGAELDTLNMAGLAPPEIVSGSIGPMAPVLGAAMMPLRAGFAPDPELLVRWR
ncbi:MAG: ROK family transcriptional regulator [Pseudomonadota bacterium]